MPKLALIFIFALTALRIFLLKIASIELSFDEAQYWHWSNFPDFGYFSKPPMVAWAIYATTHLCGETDACIRLASPLAHLLTALILGAAGAKMMGQKIGGWVGVSYASLAGVSFSSAFISTDPFLLLFWAASLYFLIRAMEEENKYRFWLGAGLCMGLGMLAKYALIALPIGFLLHLICQKQLKEKIKGFLLSLVVMVLVYLPNWLWNAAHDFVSYSHTKDNANLKEGIALHPLKALEFLGAQAGVFGPVLLVGLIMLLVKRKTTKLPPHTNLLLWLTLPLPLIMTVQGLISRANANWAAAAYVAGTLLVVGWLALNDHEKWLKISLALSLVIQLAVPFALNNTKAAQKLKGWSEAGQKMEEVLREYPKARLLFEERKTLTPFLRYVNPHPFDRVAKWNDDDKIDDHYELTVDAGKFKNQDFILVTREANDKRFNRYFKKVKPLKTIEVGKEKPHMTLYLYYAKNFAGYGVR